MNILDHLTQFNRQISIDISTNDLVNLPKCSLHHFGKVSDQSLNA